MTSAKSFIARTAALTLILTPLLAQPPAKEPNSLDNGDFSKGKAGWRVDPGMNVIDEPVAPTGDPNGPAVTSDADAKEKNKVLEVKADDKIVRKLTQTVRLDRKTKVVILRARVKAGPDYASATPSGSPISMGGHPNGGGGLVGMFYANKEGWKDCKLTLQNLGNSRTLEFYLHVNEGTGTLLLDDLVVEEKEK